MPQNLAERYEPRRPIVRQTRHQVSNHLTKPMHRTAGDLRKLLTCTS